MKKIIVFDFNRTLYDPDTEQLVPRAKFMLRTLLRRGFILCLFSQARQSRKRLIRQLCIEQYFSHVIFSQKKSKADLNSIISRYKSLNRKQSFVVGDRTRKEIAIGNMLGLQTIWVRRGRFATEFPRKKSEQPSYIVSRVDDALRILR